MIIPKLASYLLNISYLFGGPEYIMAFFLVFSLTSITLSLTGIFGNNRSAIFLISLSFAGFLIMNPSSVELLVNNLPKFSLWMIVVFSFLALLGIVFLGTENMEEVQNAWRIIILVILLIALLDMFVFPMMGWKISQKTISEISRTTGITKEDIIFLIIIIAPFYLFWKIFSLTKQSGSSNDKVLSEFLKKLLGIK